MTSQRATRRAVFFDRDDTLIECRSVVPSGDLGDPSLVRLRAGAFEACAALKAAGWFLAVVSNQGGVARGKYGLDQVGACNDRMNELLGGAIDAFRFCPFHPAGVVCGLAVEHPWRKPAPGMLLDVAEHYGVDLSASWMVGDAERDVEAGKRAGCRSILISDDVARGAAAPATVAERVVGDVLSAAAVILGGEK